MTPQNCKFKNMFILLRPNLCVTACQKVCEFTCLIYWLCRIEFKRSHFRSMIFHYLKSSLNEHQCFERLRTVFQTKHHLVLHFFDWLSECYRGWRSLEDEDRCGRSPSTNNNEQSSAVDAMVKQDAKDDYDPDRVRYQDFIVKCHCRLAWEASIQRGLCSVCAIHITTVKDVMVSCLENMARVTEKFRTWYGRLSRVIKLRLIVFISRKSKSMKTKWMRLFRNSRTVSQSR